MVFLAENFKERLIMFYELLRNDKMHPLFQHLENCKGVNQREDHHPEVDLFSHSVQVLNLALKDSDDIDLIFAAMLHDIGKQINTLGHDDYSADMCKGYISEKTEWLIRNHIRIIYLFTGEMKKQKKVKNLVYHPWFPDLVMLRRWDTLGRKPNYVIKYDRVETLDRIYKKFNNLDIKL